MIDFTKPYSEVHGQPGISFLQDGKCFNAGGHEVNPKEVEPINHDLPQPSPRDDTPIFPAIVQGEAESENDGIESMHWKKLKVLVETYGGEWSNREQAIKYLKGDRSNGMDGELQSLRS